MEIQPKAEVEPSQSTVSEPFAPAMRPRRPLVFVGLMGAGKTSVGRRVAALLGIPFLDTDERIVAAAGMSIPDIFEAYGETAFRDVERRVIGNLFDEPVSVLAYGGGAFMDAATRLLTLERAYSIWLRADIDTLVARTSRKKGTRPLLEAGDPREILHNLSAERGPIYAQASLTVDTGEQTAQELAIDIVAQLRALGWLETPAPAS